MPPTSLKSAPLIKLAWPLGGTYLTPFEDYIYESSPSHLHIELSQLSFLFQGKLEGGKGQKQKNEEGCGLALVGGLLTLVICYFDVLFLGGLMNIDSLSLSHKERFMGFPLVGFALATGVIICVSCFIVSLLFLLLYCDQWLKFSYV